MKRRTFISLSTAAATSCIPRNVFGVSKTKKVVVLGFDGMEPSLLNRFMAEGVMPNFEMLKNRGGYTGILNTTTPALSPVAWSSFITGCNPGKHGIFDFIHRDPKTFTPYLATSMIESGRSFSMGGMSIPLGGSKIISTRKEKPLWSYLEESGIPSLIYRLPGNYPVEVSSHVRAISGMGTPALGGDYGIATILKQGVSKEENKPGLRIVSNSLKDFRLEGTIQGPPGYANAEISILKDPSEKIALVELNSNKFILREGEWSKWVRVSFDEISGFSSISGVVRCYLKTTTPEVSMYISPVLVDPKDPALPIESPKGYARELAERTGIFSTLGLPADTKSLSNDTLNEDEYFTQALSVLEENEAAFHYEWPMFQEGLFFFYFSSLDQNSHMLWRCMDPTHPLYDPKFSPTTQNAIKFLYQRMDAILGVVLRDSTPDTPIFVLSDHGFAPFTREINLNTWLLEQGYISLKSKDRSGSFFENVDWEKTKAYGVGFSGMYINIKGREKFGSVEQHEANAITQEICSKLSSITDDGKNVVRGVPSVNAYQGKELIHSPDILFISKKGYRVSDDSILGEFSDSVIRNRTDKWSADHCMEPETVPGVLYSTIPSNSTPHIMDLAPTILECFGVTYEKSVFDGKTIL